MFQGRSGSTRVDRTVDFGWDPTAVVAGISMGTGRDWEIQSISVHRCGWGEVLQERWDLLLTKQGLPWIPEEIPAILGIETSDAVEMWRISCLDMAFGESEMRAIFRVDPSTPTQCSVEAGRRILFRHRLEGLVVSWSESPVLFLAPLSHETAA